MNILQDCSNCQISLLRQICSFLAKDTRQREDFFAEQIAIIHPVGNRFGILQTGTNGFLYMYTCSNQSLSDTSKLLSVTNCFPNATIIAQYVSSCYRS